MSETTTHDGVTVKRVYRPGWRKGDLRLHVEGAADLVQASDHARKFLMSWGYNYITATLRFYKRENGCFDVQVEYPVSEPHEVDLSSFVVMAAAGVS